ncbi:MAG: hypothetical protein V7724_05240 [Sediminicola sp.]|tara:strand:- start:17985 stop:18320 length:336 start_codon:yes stop_codon:yes gene_type:complete
MATEYAKNEKDIIEEYRRKGFTAGYRVTGGKLVDLETKSGSTPQEVFIIAEHRFEGMSNPSDMSILYVLETANGSKGTILLAYGPSGNLEAAEFFKEIPKGNYDPGDSAKP